MEYTGLALLILFIILFNFDLIIVNNNLIGLSMLGIRLKKYSMDSTISVEDILTKLNENASYPREYVSTNTEKSVVCLYEKTGMLFLNHSTSSITSRNHLSDISIRYFPIFHYCIERNNSSTNISEMVNIRVLTCFAYMLVFSLLSLVYSLINGLGLESLLPLIVVLSFLGIIGFIACKYSCSEQRKRFIEFFDCSND